MLVKHDPAQRDIIGHKPPGPFTLKEHQHAQKEREKVNEIEGERESERGVERKEIDGESESDGDRGRER